MDRRLAYMTPEWKEPFLFTTKLADKLGLEEAFEQVLLGPGVKKTMQFSLGNDELSFSSPATKSCVEEPEEFDLRVSSDPTAQLHEHFHVPVHAMVSGLRH